MLFNGNTEYERPKINSNAATQIHCIQTCAIMNAGQSSQPLANSCLVKRTFIRKKLLVSRSGQVNFTEAEEIPQGEPVMASIFTIDSHPAYVLFDSGASHSCMEIAQRYNISTMDIPIGVVSEP